MNDEDRTYSLHEAMNIANAGLSIGIILDQANRKGQHINPQDIINVVAWIVSTDDPMSHIQDLVYSFRTNADKSEGDIVEIRPPFSI